jgi:putative phosphoribosyl transferase
MTGPFHHREDAGQQLADRLAPLLANQDLVLLGIPPGGIVVAAEVARSLSAPLHPFVVCPVAMAGHSTTTPLGAVVSGGLRVIDQAVVTRLNLPRRLVDEESEEALRALSRREHRYHLESRLPPLYGRTAVLIDDGATADALLVLAVRALRVLGPARIIAAAPVMSALGACQVATFSDRCVALRIVPVGTAIESNYETFAPVPEALVQACLQPAEMPAPQST